ncbi:putative transposase-like protein, partial [Frankliniella fusca]
EEGLLLPLAKCKKTSCRTMQCLYRNEDYKGHYAAYCRKCRKYSSLCTTTFFEGTNIIYGLGCVTSDKLTQLDSLVFLERVLISIIATSDIASWKILSMPHYELGGEGVTIQIDESVISKRKYNRGRGLRKTIKEKWVLGIYDTEKKLGVVLYVVKRDRATLIPLIRQYVKQGSIIWTDGWAAYKGLDKFGYTHHTVNHSKEFKSADGTCTNGVEGYWSRLKQFCRHTNVLKSKLLAEHIDEFMYRQHFRGTESFKFMTFISHMREKYPVA